MRERERVSETRLTWNQYQRPSRLQSCRKGEAVACHPPPPLTPLACLLYHTCLRALVHELTACEARRHSLTPCDSLSLSPSLPRSPLLPCILDLSYVNAAAAAATLRRRRRRHWWWWRLLSPGKTEREKGGREREEQRDFLSSFSLTLLSCACLLRSLRPESVTEEDCKRRGWRMGRKERERRKDRRERASERGRKGD